MLITEPEPGRVLLEKQTNGSIVTTFIVTPEGGNQARVTITTDYEASGVAGFMEKLMAPAVLRGVYEKELRQLEQFVMGKAPALTTTR